LILLTVGSQLPFDRLVRFVDDWAGQNPGVKVFGQIGETRYQPKHFEAVRLVAPDYLAELASSSEMLIAHAGMGSIFLAFQCGKPIVIVPRRADLAEIRNDHQLATAKRFRGREGIAVALEVQELPRILERRSELLGMKDFPAFADDRLLARLRSWISTDR